MQPGGGRLGWLVLLLTPSPCGGASKRIKVHHLSPFVGRHGGGLLVNVTGTGFVVSTDPKCRFETLLTTATVMSPTLMQCYTPQNAEDFYEAQDVTLEVTLNGVDWSTSRRLFTFYDHSRVFVSLFEPEGGPLAGGTEILVHGSRFRYSEHLRCTWDGNSDPALKVDATFLNYHTLKCISPPSSISGDSDLEIALDDFHFTTLSRTWHYYDPAGLVVSTVDPLGGPTRGGTLIQVLGSGFSRLGGAVMHGGPAFSSNAADPHRQLSAGTFCKFSIDATRVAPDTGDYYDGIATALPYPAEGATAISRAAGSRHLRNFSAFTASSTPTLGELSSVVQATYVTPNLMYCKSPRFAGTLIDKRATLRVHVTLNRDFHDVGALSLSNSTFVLYDPREARVNHMHRTGGPLNGSTYVIITGKLFSDFTLRELPGRHHLLRCRFGWAGLTMATWQDEQTVSCYSPRVYGTGHRQSVEVDLTFNGQDYIEGAALPFVYYPRDTYQVEGSCLDEHHAETSGSCLNNHTGVAVALLQPYGGPAGGGTTVVVMGHHFAVRGPSIECQFGNLSRVSATFLNESAITCVSPPSPHVLGSFEDYALEVTLNGESNFLTDSRIPFVYYNHNETLAVSAIYPQAGPKSGGNSITVYGAGFRVLGGNLRYTCPEDEVRVQECKPPPLAEETNRGLQCVFGDLPAVHAYLRHSGNASRESTELVCRLPALPDAELLRHGKELDEPLDVCVEVTLNGNRSQATSNCVKKITYYDM